MSPHKLTTIRRYKISDDVLILILGNLDPAALWRTCKAFRRVYVIVMESQTLRYTFELAVTGMKDGPGAQATTPHLGRLDLLLAYKAQWPTLAWSHESPMRVNNPSRVGVSGGFLHEIWNNGVQYTLQLTELPSARSGHPPATPRQLRFHTSQLENVAVDNNQALIVTSHVLSSQNGQIGVRLNIRDLWTFGKHPRASAPVYDFSTNSSLRIVNVSIVICGGKAVVSLECVGGRIRHLLLDWRSLAARWIEDQDVYFLNERYLIGASQVHDTPVLNLYNVGQVHNLSVEREYELPETWKDAIFGFSPNTAPTSDLPPTSGALFYPDPVARILLLTARPKTTQPAPTPQQWLIINETYFRPSSRKDHSRVPWSTWGQYCLIRDITPTVAPIRGPCVVGTRIVYLELDDRYLVGRPAGQTTNCPSRLNIIDFPPYPDTIRSSDAWPMIGRRSMLVPTEHSREIPVSTVNRLSVEGIRVTEDNIVLFLEVQQTYRPVNVLTFGIRGRSAHMPQL